MIYRTYQEYTHLIACRSLYVSKLNPKLWFEITYIIGYVYLSFGHYSTASLFVFEFYNILCNDIKL
jgi:hypothetical protein